MITNRLTLLNGGDERKRISIDADANTSEAFITIQDYERHITRKLSLRDIYLIKNALVAKINESSSFTTWHGALLDIFESNFTSDEVGVQKFVNSLHKLLISRYSIRNEKGYYTEVVISLPQKELSLFAIESFQNAVGDFMEAMGFELEAKEKPIFGSFWEEAKYFFRGKGKKIAEEVLNDGVIALKTQLVGLPNAQETSLLASAAAAVIISLAGVDEAVVRTGSILVVKIKHDGQTKILTETVSAEIAQLLDKNPKLLKNPILVFDLISSIISDSDQIEQGDPEESLTIK